MDRTTTTVVMTLTRRGVLGQKIDTMPTKLRAPPRGRVIVAIAASAQLVHKMR